MGIRFEREEKGHPSISAVAASNYVGDVWQSSRSDVEDPEQALALALHGRGREGRRGRTGRRGREGERVRAKGGVVEIGRPAKACKRPKTGFDKEKKEEALPNGD